MKLTKYYTRDIPKGRSKHAFFLLYHPCTFLVVVLYTWVQFHYSLCHYAPFDFIYELKGRELLQA